MSYWPKGSWPSGYLPDYSWCHLRRIGLWIKQGIKRGLAQKVNLALGFPRQGWVEKESWDAVWLIKCYKWFFPLHKLICCWAGLRYIHSRAVLCLIGMRLSWGTCQKNADSCHAPGQFWLLWRGHLGSAFYTNTQGSEVANAVLDNERKDGELCSRREPCIPWELY